MLVHIFYIAANHSDFGGIFPLFTQYSDRNDQIPPKFKKIGNANTMDKGYTCARR